MPTSLEQAKAAVERLQTAGLIHEMEEARWRNCVVAKADLRTILALLSQCREALVPLADEASELDELKDGALLAMAGLSPLTVGDARAAAALVAILPQSGEV